MDSTPCGSKKKKLSMEWILPGAVVLNDSTTKIQPTRCNNYWNFIGQTIAHCSRIRKKEVSVKPQRCFQQVLKERSCDAGRPILPSDNVKRKTGIARNIHIYIYIYISMVKKKFGPTTDRSMVLTRV